MAEDHPHPDHGAPAGFVTVKYIYTEPATEVQVHPGMWKVDKLKEKLGADAALALGEVDAGGVHELADDGEVKVFDGQEFTSFPRDGSQA